MKNIGIISESSLIDDKSFIFYWTLPLSDNFIDQLIDHVNLTRLMYHCRGSK